jgi:hypothetical protein
LSEAVHLCLTDEEEWRPCPADLCEAERLGFLVSSLRLELEAERHNHRKDNEHLLERAHAAESEVRWLSQKKACSGPGYAHKAHGMCPGYTYDRT